MEKRLPKILFLITLLWCLPSCGRAQTLDSETEIYPASTSTTTPTQKSTPTPQPLDYIISELEPVKLGQGVPDAGEFDPESTEFPHLVILDKSQKFSSWNMLLPEDWLPESVADTELVIIVEEVDVWLNSQEYIGGPDIHRFRNDLVIEARDPHSGKLLSTRTLTGEEPGSFPKEAPISLVRLDGESVDFPQLKRLLATWCNKLSTAVQVLPHDFPVTSVSYSPNGEYLVTTESGGGYPGSIRIWNVEGLNATVLHTLEDSAREAKFSPDGEFIAVTSGNVRIYQVEDGSLVQSFSASGESARFVDFSPDGELIASASHKDIVRIWRIEDGELLTTFEHLGYVTSVTFSPDGEILAVGGLHPSLYDKEGNLLIQLDQDDYFYTLSVAFSSDGQILAGGSDDYTIRLWRVSDGELLQTITQYSKIQSVAFFSDGQKLATATSGVIFIWGLEDGTILQRLKGHDTEYLLSGISLSPDNLFLASGSEDGTVIIWDLENYTEATIP